jgi:hypothetical protein
MRGALFLFAATLAAPALAAEKTFDLKNFEAVSVSAGIKAEVSVGGDYSVRAVGEAEDIARLDIRVEDNALDIGRKRTEMPWRKRGPLTVHVRLPKLKAFDVSSGAHAGATGVAGGPFAMDASSGGHLSVSGSCDALSVDVSSGGHIEGEGLKCRTGAADASSGGHASIHVADSLVADASSGGHIEVYGDPENVTTETSSGGNISIR